MPQNVSDSAQNVIKVTIKDEIAYLRNPWKTPLER
jgi:hypothetical protein